MQLVGSRFDRRQHHGIAAAVLRRKRIGHQLEFLNRVHRGPDRHAIEQLLVDADPVEQKFSLAEAAAGYRNGRRAGCTPRLNHGIRQQRRELRKIAAVQRQFDDVPVADYLPDRAGLGVNYRRQPLHHHSFRHSAHAQGEVKARALIDLQNDAGLFLRLEPFLRDAERIRARNGKKRQFVVAGVGGDGRPLKATFRVPRFHLRSGDDSAGRIGDAPHDRCRRLRPSRSDGQKQIENP